MCPPGVVSLFPPVLWKPCSQILLAFKGSFSGDSSSCCWIARLGRLMCGSEPSPQWENFCSIIAFQFVSHPPNSYRILFHHDCIPLNISLWLSLDVGYLYWWVPASSCQSLFSSLFVILLFSQELGEGVSFYSTILNCLPKPILNRSISHHLHY